MKKLKIAFIAVNSLKDIEKKISKKVYVFLDMLRRLKTLRGPFFSMGFSTVKYNNVKAVDDQVSPS